MKYLLLFFPFINIAITTIIVWLYERLNEDRESHAKASIKSLKNFKGGRIITTSKTYKTTIENIVVIEDCSYCIIENDKVKYYKILNVIDEVIK
jgi:hypothetical protein